MPARTFPPFPDDLPTHPLIIVDYGLVKPGDSEEIDKLWKASMELGFWYLKNHGTECEVEEMFDMGEETLALPLDEKLKYLRGDGALTLGIKKLGSGATNEYGNPDNVEFINVSKEDALAYPEAFQHTHPSTVNVRMELTITPFVEIFLDTLETVLTIYENKLGLPAEALLGLHRSMEASGSEARCIKRPPKAGYAQNPKSKEDVFLGAHTDIGSLTILHNRLGGLQVLPPGSQDWRYVLPIPGHEICNIGDSLSIFSGGILRSNMHRTVPPPGAQANQTRWPMGYFARPANHVPLRALNESVVVRDASSRMSAEKSATYLPSNLQLKNRKVSRVWKMY